MVKPETDRLPISLVVATLNRGDRLEACLRAIAAIDLDPRCWELVVADNGSTDATAEVIRAARKYMPTTIKYVFEPARGASAARNSGTAVSVGQIVAYTDDDCYVAPDFLSKILAAFDADPELGWVTGRVELFDPSDDPATTNPSRIPLHFRPKQYRLTEEVIGANLALRRKAFEQVEGYDENLGAGAPLAAAEDLDVIARISAHGWGGAYNPDIVLSHHHGRKTADIKKLFRQYSIGRGAYTIKYLYRGQVIAFLKGVGSLRWRVGSFFGWFSPATFSMVFWETYGGFAYSALRVMQMLGLRPAPMRRDTLTTWLSSAASQTGARSDQGHGARQ